MADYYFHVSQSLAVETVDHSTGVGASSGVSFDLGSSDEPGFDASSVKQPISFHNPDTDSDTPVTYDIYVGTDNLIHAVSYGSPVAHALVSSTSYYTTGPVSGQSVYYRRSDDVSKYYYLVGTIDDFTVSDQAPDPNYSSTNGSYVDVNLGAAAYKVTDSSGAIKQYSGVNQGSFAYRDGYWVDGGPSLSNFTLDNGGAHVIDLSENAAGTIATTAVRGQLSYADVGATALPFSYMLKQTLNVTDSFGNTVTLSDSQVQAIESRFSVGDAQGGPNSGSFPWSYDPSGADLNFLTDGETATLSESIGAYDSAGAFASSSVEIVLNGPSAAEAGIDLKYYPGDDVMKKLITTTNLQWTGFYLTPAPSQSNDLGWMENAETLLDLGWKLAPIYVGRQADKTEQSGLALISNAPYGAAQQGNIDARQAAALANSAGLSSGTLYLDIEAAGDIVSSDSNEKAYAASWCKAVRQLGFTPGIYCRAGTAVVLRSVAPNATYWVANTTKAASLTSNIDTTSAGGYVFPENNPRQSNVRGASAWQYAQKLTLPGIGEQFDLDTFYNAPSALSARLTDPIASVEGSHFAFVPAEDQTIDNFSLSGQDHDVISVPVSDFSNLAQLLGNTTSTASGVTITDPTRGGTLQIAGVTKAELKANRQDFAFV